MSSSSPSSSPPTEETVGPTPISWPPDGTLTLPWIQALTTTLNHASRNLPPSSLPSVLPFQVLQHLLLAASNILHKEPNCLQIDVADAAHVVVIGDVHGQLHDVIFLLEDSGFPSEETLFVFNGDYVDRGAWGIETFVLLLAWKIINMRCVCKLRLGDSRMLHHRSFCHIGCFSFAVIMNPSIAHRFMALSKSVVITPAKRSKGKKGRKVISQVDTSILKLGSLEELSKARRTVLDPPWEGSNLIPGDVLWSDPSSSRGLSPNKERGIGLLFGPDCTEEFLKKYNLKLIIRSHEGPDARDKRHEFGGMQDGYTVDHEVESGKLITLFSAPDYPQFQATDERYNNQGAYIVLHPPEFSTPEFHTFEAIKPRPKANPYYDFEGVIDSDEELDLISMDNSSSLDAASDTQAN